MPNYLPEDMKTLLGVGGVAPAPGGTDGNDLKIFAVGNNYFVAEGGIDTITGGVGNDYIEGGAGADIILADLVGSSDTIVDFKFGDKIDLGAIDANADVGGIQNFSFIGQAAFTAAGQVRQNGRNVEVNTVGASGAEMDIFLDGLYPIGHPLTASDFVL